MNIDCPCKRTKCKRHGNCDECRAHHHSKSSKKGLTYCEKLEIKKLLRNVNKEIKYDVESLAWVP